MGDRAGRKGETERQAAARSRAARHRERPVNGGRSDVLRARSPPHALDAWIDEDKTKVGYEIPFNRHFYIFEPPRDLATIDADLKACTERIKVMIGRLSA